MNPKPPTTPQPHAASAHGHAAAQPGATPAAGQPAPGGHAGHAAHPAAGTAKKPRKKKGGTGTPKTGTTPRPRAQKPPQAAGAPGARQRRPKPRGPSPAHVALPTRRAPPQATPEQMHQAAQVLGTAQGQLGIAARTVTLQGDPTRGIFDAKERAITLTVAGLLDTPVGQAVAQAAGVDPAAIRANLDRQAELWGGFWDVWDVRVGARQGRLLVDGARRMARGTVDAAVPQLMPSLSPQQADDLAADLADVQRSEQAVQLAGQAQRQAMQQTGTAAAESLQTLAARQHLAEVMDRLSRDPSQPLNWDDLVAAARTLDELNASAADPAQSAAPGTATDQRGAAR